LRDLVGERDPWDLPASVVTAGRPRIGGGERSLYELALAVAATGRRVELRGELAGPVLAELERAGVTRWPAVDLPPRRPTPDDVVIVPEGWVDPLAYGRVALSAARTVLLQLAPPGLFGWSFTRDWTLPDPLTVPVDQLARPEHFEGMASLGFTLWSNSVGLAALARRAGVACTWIGVGWPGQLPEVPPKMWDVVAVGDNRWSRPATAVIRALDPTHRSRVAGPAEHEAFLRTVGEARILVWPSRVEGWARIQCEARAMGTVPVALATNAFADGLDDDEGAVVFGDPADLPGAIEALLGRPERLAALSARARRAASLQVDWPAYVRRVDTALAQVERGGGSRQAEGVLGDRLASLLQTLSAERDDLARRLAESRRGVEAMQARMTELVETAVELRAAAGGDRSLAGRVVRRRSWRRRRFPPPGAGGRGAAPAGREEKAYEAAVRDVLEILGVDGHTGTGVASSGASGSGSRAAPGAHRGAAWLERPAGTGEELAGGTAARLGVRGRHAPGDDRAPARVDREAGRRRPLAPGKPGRSAGRRRPAASRLRQCQAGPAVVLPAPRRTGHRSRDRAARR
jgi:hypothetical protein